jgi:tyrosyl-tRNA synthetase
VGFYETLAERGFIAQVTDEDGLKRLLDESKVTAYIGFDPTAASLHVGSLLPIMALAHLQREGHRPIALVGGGTGMVGDPSGKTEMRQLLTLEALAANAEGLKAQLAHFLDFSSDDKALMLNNADWLCPWKYIDFLREIGRHFTVNRMLTYESVKQRLDSETGLSFIEFNYMLLQAYDFHFQATHYDCRLQMGGNDQWGNITAGIDLARRLGGVQLYGLTFPLIATASGAKMGKTASGAVWLDPLKTSPYDYYQFWINTEDADVERFLAYFTFLPIEEVGELGRLKDRELNRAKEVLAYEATRLLHGQAEADKALSAAQAAFRGRGGLDDVPTLVISRAEYETLAVFQLFARAGLVASGSEARRLIGQGGALVGEKKVAAFDQPVKDLLPPEGGLIRAGKKRFKRVVVG